MSKLKIAVIISSTRPTRFGDKPAQWIFEHAKASGQFDVELVDFMSRQDFERRVQAIQQMMQMQQGAPGAPGAAPGAAPAPQPGQ